MLQLAILVKKTTLTGLAEHTTHVLSDALTLNESEALVMLDARVVRRLLDLARPEDARIDDVIMRVSL